MVLEHVGMPQPGDCRVVFSASAEELEAAIQAEQAAENPPQAEEDLLTAAVNRAILTGFSTLYQELVEKEHLVPVTDPDFELLAVNRAEGFRAEAEFYCLPPLELERYTGFTQPIQPRPIRQVSIELEVNTRHGDEDRAADAVAHPTDERAHAAALAVVGIHHVEAQIHIGQLAIPVGHHDAGHNAAKVNDADTGSLVIGKRILGHFLAAGGFVKIFPGDTHEKCPPSEWNPVGFLPSAISVGMTDRQVLSLL